MLLKPLLAVPAVLGLMGCVAGQGPATTSQVSLSTFAHRISSTHVVLYWNCVRPEAGRLQLDGVAKSPWAEVRFLEFDFVGVDSRNRTVSEVKGKAEDTLIRTNQISPFRLELQTVGSEVRFDLYYQHQFVPEEMNALLAGPPVTPPWLVAQADRYFARDVCSETSHRSR